MSFSFGLSIDAIITKAAPGASPPGSRDNGLDFQRKWAGLSRQSERSLVTLCRNFNSIYLRLSVSSTFSLPNPCSSTCPCSARPERLALQSSSLLPWQGCSKDPPPSPVGPARGHFPSLSPRVSVSSCVRRAVGRPGSDQNSQLAIAGRSPRPSPASRPGVPSAQPSRPGTILALSEAPASSFL